MKTRADREEQKQMDTASALWQIAIGIVIAVVVAAPVAAITNRVNRTDSEGGRVVVAGRDAVVDQSTHHSVTTVINYESVQNYVHEKSGRAGDEDDAWVQIVAALIGAVVVGGVFARYSNWVLLVSAGVTGTIVIWAALMFNASRQRFGKLPTPAVVITWHVATVLALTIAGWVIVLNTTRRGVRFEEAVAVAQASDSWLPYQDLVDAFGFTGFLVVASFGVAILVVALLAALAGFDLCMWAAVLRVSSAITRGATVSSSAVQLAGRFQRITSSSLIGVGILGGLAILFATGMLFELLPPSDSPTQIPGSAPIQ
ncbi:hypothetical protein GCM10027068_36840 [Prescottella soli]